MAFVRFRAFDTYVVATRRERLDRFEQEGFVRVQGGDAQRVVRKLFERAGRVELGALWQEVFGMPLSPRLRGDEIESQLLAVAREFGAPRLVCLIKRDERYPPYTVEQPPMEFSASEVREAPPGHIMWIGFELLDQTEAPLAGQAFALTGPDGQSSIKRLDAQGRSRLDPTLDGMFRFALVTESPQALEAKGAFDLQLVDSKGHPLGGADYQIWVSGAMLKTGKVDQEGWAHVDALPPGPYDLVLPGFEPDAVSLQGKAAHAAQGAFRAPGSYKVKPGDTLSKIAKVHGYKSWKTLYDAPENEALRKKRPNPHRIRAGDEVKLPGAKAAALSVGPGAVHRVVVEQHLDSPQPVRVVIDDAAVGLQELSLRLRFEDGAESVVQTDPAGSVELDAKNEYADVCFPDDVVCRLFLDPPSADTEEGAWQRLCNLGYVDIASPAPQGGPTEVASAIAAFQEDHDLTVTGNLDATTSRRMTDAHDGHVPTWTDRPWSPAEFPDDGTEPKTEVA